MLRLVYMEKQIISVLCLCRERGQCCKKKNGSGSEGCQCVHRFLPKGSSHEKGGGEVLSKPPKHKGICAIYKLNPHHSAPL